MIRIQVSAVQIYSTRGALRGVCCLLCIYIYIAFGSRPNPTTNTDEADIWEIHAVCTALPASLYLIDADSCARASCAVWFRCVSGAASRHTSQALAAKEKTAAPVVSLRAAAPVFVICSACVFAVVLRVCFFFHVSFGVFGSAFFSLFFVFSIPPILLGETPQDWGEIMHLCRGKPVLAYFNLFSCCNHGLFCLYVYVVCILSAVHPHYPCMNTPVTYSRL